MYNIPPHMSPRSTRSPWKYIAIGGAACAVCVVVASVSTVYFIRARSDVRAKELAAASSELERGAGATIAPTSMVSEAPEPALPEEPGAPPGTPAASLRKRPAWGKIDNVRSGNEKVSEYAPQLSRPEEAFSAASPLVSDVVERALLVCRAQTFAKSDAFAGDDLQVRGQFGHTPLVVNDGPEDANQGYVSAPLASLKKGETVRFEVFDRDVWELETIAKPLVTWNGGPLTVLDPATTIECRVLSGDPLSKLVSVHATEADRAVRPVQTAKLQPTSPTWDYPTVQLLMARRSVADVAALTGWDDPHAMRRVATLDAAVIALDGQRPLVFDGLHDSAGTTATIGKLTVSNPRTECTPSGAGCTVHVTLENHAELPLSFVSYDGLSLYAATREGGPHAAAFAHADRTELAAGETMELAITPDTGLKLGTLPSILGVCMASHCAPVKLK